jgi:AcrR family transcriptional regulator
VGGVDRPKTGRPAKLDRAMIARAAHEIGLDRVTMKAVAGRLGVSVPGLYHYVDGREDLMRLGAEYSASQIQVPKDHGQHWTAWLLDWARYSYDAFVAQPALLLQFLNGSLGVDRMVEHVDAVVGVLTRQGFTPVDAVEAYEVVSDCALGAAVGRIREEAAARAGRPVTAEYHRVLAMQPPDAYPHLRKLLAADERPALELTARIETVLMGIAARRNEPWEGIRQRRATGGEPPGVLMHP